MGPNLTEILHARFLGGPRLNATHQQQAAKSLIAQAGSLPPQKLSSAHVLEVEATIPDRYHTAATRYCHANALRFILRWLWEYHAAPKLDTIVRRYPSPRPRNVTVSENDRARLLANAAPHLRLWLLLCSDLAMRSGTAINIGPENYDYGARLLSFTTKCDEHLTLPATQEVSDLIDLCDPSDPRSFVRQLWAAHRKRHHITGPMSRQHCASIRYQFRNLCDALGISRNIRPHDLRRTTAVAMLEHTHDIREVQSLLGHKNLSSTFWYLDHNLRPIKRSTLELIKRPSAEKEERKA